MSPESIRKLCAALGLDADRVLELLREQGSTMPEVPRDHGQQVGGHAHLGVAVSGDQHGPMHVDQSTDKRHIINVIQLFQPGLGPGEINAVSSAVLQAIGMQSAAPPQLAQGQRADQLRAACAGHPWPPLALRRAFARAAPHHRLPDGAVPELLAAILQELAHNAVHEAARPDGDPLDRFVRALVEEPALDDAQRAALRAWLGAPPPAAPPPPRAPLEEPGLLIAVDRLPGSDSYHIRAWLWPERRCLWPPVGQVPAPVAASGVPDAIRALHAHIHHQIARFGGAVRIELLLHHSLLVEPAHEWKISVSFAADDPEDREDSQLHGHYLVVVRSVERALSQEPPMVDARQRWRERWAHLLQSCARPWRRPVPGGVCSSPDDAQQPPFFCPRTAEEFVERLYERLIGNDFLCFVETVPPPSEVDFAKKVVRRVVRAGLPLGMWYARDVERSELLYRPFEAVLHPQHLPDWPRVLRDYWRGSPETRPIFFIDDPTRLPYDPDDVAFESASAG